MLAFRERRLTQAPAASAILTPGIIGLLGVPGFIYVTEPVPAAVLVAAVAGAEPASFVLLLDGLAPELEDALVASGWSLRRTLEMMVLPTPDNDVPLSPGLDVGIETIDESNVGEAQDLSQDVFGVQTNLTGAVGGVHAGGQLTRDDDGRVIAMGGWQRAGDGARIAGLATRPEHRGRGLGGLMTLAAVDGARRSGARFAYLEATSDGAGVYRRVGFRTLGIWRVLHRPELISR